MYHDSQLALGEEEFSVKINHPKKEVICCWRLYIHFSPLYATTEANSTRTPPTSVPHPIFHIATPRIRSINARAVLPEVLLHSLINMRVARSGLRVQHATAWFEARQLILAAWGRRALGVGKWMLSIVTSVHLIRAIHYGTRTCWCPTDRWSPISSVILEIPETDC